MERTGDRVADRRRPGRPDAAPTTSPSPGDRVDVDHAAGHVALTRLPRFVDPADQVAEGSLLAPMPGTVIAVRVEAGATVTAGQPVLVMEAMKMQHTITAPTDGVVTDLAGRRRRAGHRRRRAGRREHPDDETDDPRPSRPGGDRMSVETQTMFSEPEERVALREAVRKLAASYGREYIERQAAAR